MIPKPYSMLLAGLLSLAVMTACGDDPPGAEAPESTGSEVRLSDAQQNAAGIVIAPTRVVSLQPTVSVPGSIQPPDTAQMMVGSFVEGRIVSVSVLPGQAVQQGQPLVDIHSHELLTAQRDLTSARASLEQRGAAVERSELLLVAGAVSLEEVEVRRADFAAAEAELHRAEEMVAHLHPSAEGNVQTLAPRSGTVFTVSARPGQAVLPGTPLLEMGSTDVLWVTAFVPENSARSTEPGQVVTVRFGSTQSVTAHLVGTSSHVDPGNRSVEVRFELDSVPVGVRPGSFAVVDVPSADVFEGVELSEEAVVRLGEADVVFVSEGSGSFRPVTVEAVPMGAGRIAVRGLPPGAEVVDRGAYFLKAAAELASTTEVGAGS